MMVANCHIMAGTADSLTFWLALRGQYVRVCVKQRQPSHRHHCVHSVECNVGAVVLLEHCVQPIFTH